VQYYRTLERTFAVDAAPELRIANRRGELTIIGEDRDDIAFTAQLSVSADSKAEGEERLDAIDIPISQEGGAVIIGEPEHDEPDGGVTLFRLGWHFGIRAGITLSETRVDMVARVPRLCRVQATHRSGAARVTGIHAHVHIEGRSGATDVRDVGGPLQVESRSGAIEVRDIAGDVTLISRSGRVDVENVQGDAEVRSRSGYVNVNAVGGRLSVSTRSGRMTLRDVAGPTTVSGRSGAVEWRGAVRRPVSIEVESGFIRLAIERGAGFYLDAETQRGSVRSELPVDHLEKPRDDAPSVRLRTHTGAIRIVAA
jgi:hypothetical protein